MLDILANLQSTRLLRERHSSGHLPFSRVLGDKCKEEGIWTLEFQPTALARKYKSGDTLASCPVLWGREFLNVGTLSNILYVGSSVWSWTCVEQRSWEGGKSVAKVGPRLQV